MHWATSTAVWSVLCLRWSFLTTTLTVQRWRGDTTSRVALGEGHPKFLDAFSKISWWYQLESSQISTPGYIKNSMHCLEPWVQLQTSGLSKKPGLHFLGCCRCHFYCVGSCPLACWPSSSTGAAASARGGFKTGSVALPTLCLSLFSQCMLSCSVVSNSLWPLGLEHTRLLFVGFSRPDYCSGLPFPSPGDLPHSGIKPMSLATAVVFLIH